jgi:hypothetical protein
MGSLVPTLICCMACAHPDQPPIVQRAEVRTMQAAPVVPFVPGPELLPVDALRAWLDERGATDPAPMLRLPVVLSMDQGLALGVTRAWIGVLPQPPEDALLIRVDDTTLGIALTDRLAEYCAPDATTCALWLDGTWGSPLPLLLPAVPGAPPVFTLRSVKGLIAPGEEVRVYVQAETTAVQPRG